MLLAVGVKIADLIILKELSWILIFYIEKC
jgi:hypothetical protein